MARLAGGLIGAAIGSAFGMPQLGFMVGSMAAGALFPTESRQEGPRIGDLTASSSSYGQPIPKLYGTCRLGGNMIWSTGLQETRKSKKSTDKLGGTSTTQISYTYKSSFAIALCEGEGQDLLRIWADNKLIFDRTQNGRVGSANFSVRFYTGSETQLPDPLIEAAVGTLGCPAYRGLCYLVFENMDLANFGNRIPNITAEITMNSTTLSPMVKWVKPTSSKFNTANDIYGDVSIDWVRRRGYALRRNSVTGKRGISVFNIDTMEVVLEKYAEEMLEGYAFTEYDLMPDQIGLASGGEYLYWTTPGFFIYNNLFAFHLDTLQMASVFKSAMHFDTWNFKDAFMVGYGNESIVVQRSMNEMGFYFDNICVSCQRGEYAILGNVDGALGMVSGYRTSFGWIEAAYKRSSGTIQFVPGTQNIGDPLGDSSVYMLNWNAAGGSSIEIWKIAIMGSASTKFVFDLKASYFGDSNIVLSSAVFDQSDDTLILRTHTATGISFRDTKINDDGDILWTKVVGNFPGVLSAANSVVRGSRYALGGFSNAIVEPIRGTIEFSGSATGSTGLLTASAVWDSDSESSIVVTANAGMDIYRVFWDRNTGEGEALSDIIKHMCFRSGLDAVDVDTTGVDQTVSGYLISRPTSARAVLEQICGAYFIEVVESDFKLKFRKRGGAAVATVEQKWLGSGGSSEGSGEFWKQDRTQELELPRRVTVQHIDREADYQPGIQHDQRVSLPYPTQWANEDAAIEFPVVLTATEAKQLAQKVLYTKWVERNRYESVVPWRFLELDPTDTVTVTLDAGDSYTVRISQTQIGADLSIKTNFVSEDEASFVSTAVGSGSDGFPQQELTTPAPGRLFMLNVPLLRDADYNGSTVSHGYYLAGAYSVSWRGGLISSSADSGGSYQVFDTIVSPAAWGTSYDALANTTEPFSTDITNTVTVAMADDGGAPLTSCTRAELLADSNMALLGDEIIQYQTVTANTDGSYTLSNLLRGRRGTEWACGTHRSGDTLIVLSDIDVAHKNIPASSFNVSKLWKLVSFGMYAEDIPPTTFAWTGADLKPYAPVNFRRAAVGSDLALTWVRRTRYDGGLVDGTGTVPLAEDSEAYEVYILAAAYDAATFDATDASTYVRAFTGLTTAAATYTAAQMATDSFTPSTGTLHLVAFQRGSTIGRGFPGWASLTP